ncbi:unnamed protein product [Mytilus edulis]|uniref:B box-type domain-containing protein n=1 Tax=Mytilus edulis TaxID=6550 RepID=A0A8S3PQR9_MYTED|nr:unnamed protein product [Mytilus edulis]
MASSTTTCGVCEQINITKTSTIWCFECDEGLCAECKDHHSRSKGTRKHDTLPISEYQKIPRDIVKITDTCANHNEKFAFIAKSMTVFVVEVALSKTIWNENDREITEIQTKIENIKQHATDLQTFIAMKELEERISSKDQFLQSMINSENFKDSEISYNPNATMQDLANRSKNFGKLKIEKKSCNVVLTRRKDKQAQILLPHILSRSVDNIDLKLLQTINEPGDCVRGCCMLPDGKMAFSHNSRTVVRVFNLNGTKDFEVNTGTHAFDVAYISHDNTLAVTSGESNTKCITIIDIQSKQIKKKYQSILSITA